MIILFMMEGNKLGREECDTKKKKNTVGK